VRCFSEGRRLVEVAALGLPLPTLGAVAVAALAGPFDLGGGPLEAGADLVGFQLGDRPLVPQARSRLDETAAYIDQFTAAERRAGTWWAKVEIPLSLIEGITIPAYGIAAKEVLGAGEFATENADDLRLARERAAVWLTDLRTLNRASPTLTAVLISRTLTFVLSGDFWHDFLRGVEGRDVAFLIGRIIRGSLEAPSFSFDILLEVIGHCLDIWTALHALPNVIRGIGERAVDEARVAVELEAMFVPVVAALPMDLCGPTGPRKPAVSSAATAARRTRPVRA
jgi:hypothetical protein